MRISCSQGRPPQAPPGGCPRRVAALERADPLRRPDRRQGRRGSGRARGHRHGAVGSRQAPGRRPRAGPRRGAGRLLLDIVRHLPAQQVELKSGDGPGLLTLECGASRYSLHTYDADDFPRLPEIDHGRTFGVDKDTFLQAADRVLRAASRDDSRPVLTGVLVEFADGVLTMAATDSYRMAVRTTKLEGGPPESLTAIVPARALCRPHPHLGGARRRGPRDRRRGEPGALRHGGRVAGRPSHRGAVPRVPPAAARHVRARGRRCRARSSPT